VSLVMECSLTCSDCQFLQLWQTMPQNLFNCYTICTRYGAKDETLFPHSYNSQ